MSDELNDSDSSSCEWSLVSYEGEVETLNAVAENSSEVISPIKDYDTSSSTGEPKVSVDEKMKISDDDKESTDISKSDDLGESDTSSDIERIDEPPTIQTSLESSSRFSNFCDINPLDYHSSSFLLGNSDLQIGTDTKSDASLEDSAIQILLSGNHLRSYRHTPNQRLNIILNILLGLTVAAVVGLGIGHFIGWSNQWFHQRHLQQSHLSVLHHLEEELRSCLQKQQDILIDTNLMNLQPCYEKADHWKQQLNKILLNKNVDNLITGSRNINQCSDEDNYQKLKSEFIHKQLEHIEALKQFEQIKAEERKFRQKFKSLEDENNDLKIKLELEEEEDTEEQMILYFIMKENVKLRLTIDNLQNNLQENLQHSVFPEQSSNKPEIGTLREQINQLQTENEDLRQIIARLRYSHALNSKLNEEIQNKFNQLETENMDLKMEIGKMRYSKPVESSEFSLKKETITELPHVGNVDDDLVEEDSEASENSFQTEGRVQDESSETKQDSQGKKESKQYLDISDQLLWIKDKIPRLDKDDEQLLDAFINRTLENYWQNKNFLDPQAFFTIINESLTDLLHLLQRKWDAVNRLSTTEDPITKKNKPFLEKVLSIWEKAKVKLVQSLTTSKQKLIQDKPWKKFMTKIQKMLSTIQKKLVEAPKKYFKYHKENSESASYLESNSHENKFDEDEPKFVPQARNKKSYVRKTKHFVDDSSEEKKWRKKSKREKDDSSWIFKRAEFREKKKLKERQAEWLFDRARDRAEQRQLK